MLRRIYVKKILISFSALFALLLIYLIPNNKYSEEKTIPQSLEYIDSSVNTHEIFLIDSNNYIARTVVALNNNVNTIEDKAKELLEVLIVDGDKESTIPSGFRSIISSDTKINSIVYKDGTIKVDFSKELLDVKVELEEKMVEAIVYTLTSIDEVQNVIIYVDGKLLNKLPQTNINLPSTLNRNFGINKTYDLETIKDITQVTIYYINKYNDDYYYVPVTKYVNDSRDKIKIIVESLASGPTYESNLMSFLNNNAKLLVYEEQGDIMDLQFNSYIFNDAAEKDILEEVIYTISLSIADNYDVAEVVFKVDNEEIHKSIIKTLE